MAIKQFGLIKTIEDDEEVEDFSEDSDVEINFQPSKQKDQKLKDFDKSFEFVTNINEYNENVWDDLSKYIKRKAKTKTDDKIRKAREKIVDESVVENDEIQLSDTELKYDNIKVKEQQQQKKKKNKNKANEEKEEYFEMAPAYDESVTFQQMNLSRPLMKAMTEMKFVHPTPIQAATIPPALLGKDICGCAATGTGKTAAYMLPTLERLLYRPKTSVPLTRVLILVPTRELGVQVYQVTKQLAQYTNVVVALAVGGLDLKQQEIALRKIPDVVIATPGRLIDHLKSTPTFTLDSIEILILDEADRMLDEYFAEQMKEIIKQCSRTRQTMLFSATMTDEVNDLISISLTKPLRLFVDSNKDVAFNLRQEFVRIRSENDRETILIALVLRTFHKRCIVFVQTKKLAHRLHVLLGLLGLKVAELHGNLTQPQRLESLRRFKEEAVDYLIATDVAARGLDIPDVTTVINFSMPYTIEQYIHRVGRTARAGRAGVSISLAGEQDRKIVKSIVKRAKNPVKTRIISPEILAKYKTKLELIELKVQEILKEEQEERLLSKMENQTNRLEKLINGHEKPTNERERTWFQSNTERKDEENRLKLTHKEMLKNKLKDTKKKKKKQQLMNEQTSDMKRQLTLQARNVKKTFKPKKINACIDDTDNRSNPNQRSGTKRKSNFTDELCNVSKKRTKNLRYEANFKQKQNDKHKKQKKNGGGGGKAFGKPQQKKQKNRRKN